jgi:hypothetical protein
MFSLKINLLYFIIKEVAITKKLEKVRANTSFIIKKEKYENNKA